jgi:hypothetical protein
MYVYGPLLTSSAAALAAALLAAFAARRFAARHPGRADALLALGLACGFVASMHAVDARPSFPLDVSDDAWLWVVWIVPAGALLGASALGASPRPASSAVVHFAFGTGAVWLVLRPLVPHALPLGVALLRAALCGAAVALLAGLLAHRARQGVRAALTLPLVLALAGATYVLLSGAVSLELAEAALALACGVAATAALAPWARVPSVPVAAAPAIAGGYVALLAAAHASLNHGSTPRFPAACALLLFGAACCAFLPRWRWGVVAALACVAGAAALSVRWDEAPIVY